MSDKTVSKHIFFLSKQYNWQIVPLDRKLKYTQSYILNTCKQVGKLQDWRRIEFHTPSDTPETMLKNAISVGAIS